MKPFPLVIGIDEAGYGPTLGPLVFGVTVFEPRRSFGPDWWTELDRLVTRTAAPGDPRIAVNDSKAVFEGRQLGRLEHGVLSFFPGKNDLPAKTLEDLWEGSDPGALPPWYRRSPAKEELPVEVSQEALDRSRRAVCTELKAAGLNLLQFSIVPLLETRLNASFQRTGNKAASHLDFVAALMRDRLSRSPSRDLDFRIDRLGGRRYYSSFLASLFPFAPLAIEEENRQRSSYRVREKHRTVRISFEVKSDSLHLPVALASMGAKYVRELFLRRMNGHFAKRKPGLRATAGYPQDAARYLDELAELLTPQQRQKMVRIL